MVEELLQQITNTSRTIYTDSYSMSVGELMNMYLSEEKEIDIHPEFQRNYRWDLGTKSKLIESLLLGIPVPPIFVFQNENGVWDVIDGHQRLSTIFECAGIYHNEKNEKQPPLQLSSGKFLSALEGVVWESEDPSVKQFPMEIRLRIKRAKIDVKILKSTSDKVAKYDLFQRLNSGGQALTPQEIRNCLIIMEDATFYQKLLKMRNFPCFSECLPLSENAKTTQEDLEFVVRFLVARKFGVESIPSSLHDYFDDSIIKIIRDSEYDIDNETSIFERLFSLLSQTLGEDIFKRYVPEYDAFKGPVTLSAFEAIVPYFSQNIDIFETIDAEKLKRKIKGMHTAENYSAKTGRRSTDRYKHLLQFGQEYFDVGEIDQWQ